MRFPRPLYELIVRRAAKEGAQTINQYICDLCKRGLKNTAETTVDRTLLDLKEKQMKLQEQERNFLAQLKQIMSTSRDEPKPKEFDEYADQILAAIGKKHRSFNAIASMTNIDKAMLIVILAKMNAELTIAIDADWKYYQV